MRLFIFICILMTQFTLARTIKISSPDSILQLTFSFEDGTPVYRVDRFGLPVIKTSKLGFIFKNIPAMLTGFNIDTEKTSSFDETWTQPWGEKKYIRNNYNYLRVTLIQKGDLSRKVTIDFRVYNDGIGFRYEFPKQENLDSVEILDEISEFAFAGNHHAWWIKAYQWNRYEYLYNQSPLSTVDTAHTPFTLETSDRLYLSIHEAVLTDFASFTLANKGNYTFKTELVPWSDGIKVKTSTPFKTPWRTIQIADSPGELITSYLILNLNEPNKLKDTSWIKPGKYVGIWWEMHLALSTWGSGEKHGATNINTKRYIDFAAKYGFDGVLVEGWNIGWDGDWIQNGDKFLFTTPYPDFDINYLTKYASEKGVGLIGHHETGGGILNYENQMKDAFAYYNKLGIRAVKTGYVNHGTGIKRIDRDGIPQGEWHHGQFMVRHYRKALKMAAENQIMIDAHEPIKDTGIRRTYPNMMTREGARGQEFNAWGPNGGNPPDYTTILPFTRLLAGPMDFTPGIFDLLFEEAKPDNRVNTTLTKQLALYVVIFSPLHMAADLPENYEARADAFKFIRDVPTDWEDTVVPHASIGNYITIARKDRNSEDWYLGSITDKNGRILETSLFFLPANRQYIAEIYRDGINADWKTKPYDYEIVKQKVNRDTILKIRLAPGGGQAIRFSPAK